MFTISDDYGLLDGTLDEAIASIKATQGYFWAGDQDLSPLYWDEEAEEYRTYADNGEGTADLDFLTVGEALVWLKVYYRFRDEKFPCGRCFNLVPMTGINSHFAEYRCSECDTLTEATVH